MTLIKNEDNKFKPVSSRFKVSDLTTFLESHGYETISNVADNVSKTLKTFTLPKGRWLLDCYFYGQFDWHRLIKGTNYDTDNKGVFLEGLNAPGAAYSNQGFHYESTIDIEVPEDTVCSYCIFSGAGYGGSNRMLWGYRVRGFKIEEV